MITTHKECWVKMWNRSFASVHDRLHTSERKTYSRTEMGIKTLLSFLKIITEDSNLANLNGLVPAVDASCWIHKAISLSCS